MAVTARIPMADRSPNETASERFREWAAEVIHELKDEEEAFLAETDRLMGLLVVNEDRRVPRELVNLGDLGLEKVVEEVKGAAEKKKAEVEKKRKPPDEILVTNTPTVREVVRCTFHQMDDELSKFSTVLSNHQVPTHIQASFASIRQSCASAIHQALLEIPEVAYKAPHVVDRDPHKNKHSDLLRHIAYLEQALVEMERNMKVVKGRAGVAEEIMGRKEVAVQRNKSHLLRELIKLKAGAHGKSPIIFRNTMEWEGDEEEEAFKIQLEQIWQVIDYCNGRWGNVVAVVEQRGENIVTEARWMVEKLAAKVKAQHDEITRRLSETVTEVLSEFEAQTTSLEGKILRQTAEIERLRHRRRSTQLMHTSSFSSMSGSFHARCAAPQVLTTHKASQTSKDLFLLSPSDVFFADTIGSRADSENNPGSPHLPREYFDTATRLFYELSKAKNSVCIDTVRKFLGQTPDNTETGAPLSSDDIFLDFIPKAVPTVVPLQAKRTSFVVSGIPHCESCKKRKVKRGPPVTAFRLEKDPQAKLKSVYSKRLHKYAGSISTLSCASSSYTISVPVGRDPPEMLNTVGSMTCA